jgi:hypothetical protein
MQIVGTDTIAGVEVEILANARGAWEITTSQEGGRREPERLGYAAEGTLDEAKSRARTVLAKRKVKVEVPFRLRDGSYGVATGIHAGTGAVLARVIRRGREQAEQIERRTDAFKPETPDEAFDKMTSLKEQQSALYSEQKALEDEWAIDRYGLKGAVSDAISDATERQAADDEAAEQVRAEVDPAPIGTVEVDAGGRA